MTRVALLATLTFAAGCGAGAITVVNPCDGQSGACLDVDVEGAIGSVDTIELSLSGAVVHLVTAQPSVSPTQLPVAVGILLPDSASGVIQIGGVALLLNSQVGSGETSVTVSAGMQAHAVLEMTSSSGPIDLSANVDMLQTIDGASPMDLADRADSAPAIDLAGPIDLAADLAIDLSVQIDLATPVDLESSSDFTGQVVDFSTPVDFSAPIDLTLAQDFAAPVDMSMADLTLLPDLAPPVDLTVNPCAMCDPNAQCMKVNFAEMCVCNPGYQGNGMQCTPINLCLNNNGGCDLNATCTYTGPNTRTCACNPGYTGDGIMSCKLIWTLIETIGGTSLGSPNYVAGFNQKIYFANSDMTLAAPYFKSFNVPNDLITAEIESKLSGFCGCNYESIPIASDNRIYYVANAAAYYDTGPRQWTTLANYPLPRGESGVAATNNNVIYFIGGRTGNSAYDQTVSALNTANNVWSPPGLIPNYPTPIYWPAATAINQTIYVFGGQTNVNDHAENGVAMFMPNVWKSLKPAPAQIDRAYAVVYGNLIYIQLTTGVMLIYNPANDTWNASSEMPPNVVNMKLVAANNQLFAIGDSGATVVIYRYNF